MAENQPVGEGAPGWREGVQEVAGETAIVPKEQPGAIVNWEEQLAREARDEAAKERVFASKLSKTGGVIAVGGVPLGQTLPVVILGSAFMKTLYETQYDPDDTTPPSCWAIAENEEDLVADPEVCWKVVSPEGCARCPANQFKSGRGKAKACGDRRRFIVMAANDLKDPETIQKAEVYTAEQPATGLKTWAFFVKALRDTFQRPPYAMLTELSTLAVKNWHIWSFKAVGVVGPEHLQAIMEKRKAIMDQLMVGWQKPAEDPALKEQKNAPKKF